MKTVLKLSRKRVKSDSTNASQEDQLQNKINLNKDLITTFDQYDSSPDFQPKRTKKLPLKLPRDKSANQIRVDSVVMSLETVDKQNAVIESQPVIEDEGVVSEEKRMCAGCCKLVPAATYNSHLHHCLKRFRSNSAVDECPHCTTNLKGLNKVRKQEHIQRCERMTSNGDSSALSQQPILECPFCGKYDDDPHWREVHMKKCAQSKHYSLEEYDQAIRLQERQVQEKLAAGLPAGPAKPIATKTLSRKIRPTVAEPTTFHQEDLQMAKAMSLSLAEEAKILRQEENFVFEALKLETTSLDEILRKVLENSNSQGQKVAGRKNKIKNVTPLLLLRSADDRANIIAERAAEILSETREEYNLNTCTFYVNWRDIKVKRKWTSNLSQSRLWKLSTLSEELIVDPKCFYTSAFLEHELPTPINTSKSNHRRISLIPGYKLSSNNKSSTEETMHCSLSTQDIVAQLYNQNNRSLVSMDNSENANISFCVKGNYEEMGDGFFTQVHANDSEKCLKLSSNLLEMVGNFTLSDVTIYVESDITIPCHRFILLCRCPAAYKELHTSNATSEKYILDWRTISYGGAIAFLKYLYGEVKPHDSQMDEILILARRYGINAFLTNEFDQHLSYSDNDFSEPHQSTLSDIEENGETEFIKCDSPVSSHSCTNLPLNRSVKTVVADLVENELPGASNSPISGSSSPLLFDTSDFDNRKDKIDGATVNLRTSKLNLTTDLLEFDKNSASVLLATENQCISSGTLPNVDTFEVKMEFLASTPESNSVTKRKILDDSDKEYFASLKKRLKMRENIKSQPDVTKRKILDDSDKEYFASLKKRLKMRENIKNQPDVNVMVDFDMENESPDIALSPYAPAEISDVIYQFDIDQDDNFNVEKSPVSSSSENQHLSEQQTSSPITQANSNDSDNRFSQLEKQPNKKRIKVKKQKPVTPMPRYSIMETPEISKQLKKIGVRNLGKKKGVNLLKHVFKETHKNSDSCEADDSSSISSSPELVKSSASQRISSSDKDTKSVQSKNFNEEILLFLKKNKDLYTDMLLLKTIVIEDFHKQLRDSGIKCNIYQLKEFLDSQCVSFKSAEEKGRRRRTVKSKSQ